jgi:hypothetical protein
MSYDKLVDARYFELEQTSFLRWKTGQIAIIGPKAFDFYSAFAEGKATYSRPMEKTSFQ